jgi:hypothetical protein
MGDQTDEGDIFSYFRKEEKKATSSKDIEEMKMVVDDLKIQIKILYKERERLELETLR